MSDVYSEPIMEMADLITGRHLDKACVCFVKSLLRSSVCSVEAGSMISRFDTQDWSGWKIHLIWCVGVK